MVFNAKNTSKAIGLQKIADFYDIPKERVIYFGDNINDVEALE
ncbi:MAG: hypothetical protein DRP42_01925 [Tenericutes bacterium]|nr:MAG: hypothetical protein DRP42_01925 [Mycoplasmatota bacterium]